MIRAQLGVPFVGYANETQHPTTAADSAGYSGVPFVGYANDTQHPDETS